MPAMLFRQFLGTIRTYGLVRKNDRIVVGVSGGPDSVALLYLLARIRKDYNLTLHVAHLDHGLRKSSSRDALFTRRLAEKLHIPVTVSKASASELSGRGSPEESARNARFKFFFRVARRTRSRKIALGHTLDDQAETVLMRLLRGAGLSGLAAISPKRKFGSIEVIRPLLESRRRDVEFFLKRKKIKACHDETNTGDLYLRNRIRRRLIPLLEKEYNPNIKEVLARTAEAIACDYDYLFRQAAKQAQATGAKISLKKLIRLHPAVQRLLVRLSIGRLKGDTRRITFRHIREIEDLIRNRPCHSVVNLPRGVCVAKTRDSLHFFRRKK